MPGTFQSFLAEQIREGIIDFALRATIDPRDKSVTFYIHPEGRDGITRDWRVSGDTVKINLDVRQAS